MDLGITRIRDWIIYLVTETKMALGEWEIVPLDAPRCYIESFFQRVDD